MSYPTQIYLVSLADHQLHFLLKLCSSAPHPTPFTDCLASAAATEIERRVRLDSESFSPLEPAPLVLIRSMTPAEWSHSMSFCAGIERAEDDFEFGKFLERLSNWCAVIGKQLLDERDQCIAILQDGKIS